MSFCRDLILVISDISSVFDIHIILVVIEIAYAKTSSSNVQLVIKISYFHHFYIGMDWISILALKKKGKIKNK